LAIIFSPAVYSSFWRFDHGSTLFVIMLLGCVPVWGQAADTAVSGRIQMPKGGPASSIPVVMTTLSSNNRISIRTQTSDDGSFHFENVKPGEYIVLAGALAAEATDGVQAVVLTTPTGILARSEGTYFPGTANASAATAIAVTAGTRIENVNFALAAGALNWGGPQFQTIPAKIVVEGGGTPLFHSDQFGLTFSDSPANVSDIVTFQDGPRKPAAPLIRIERTREPFLATSIVPMPSFPSGEFRLALPEGLIRVSPVAPIQPAAQAPPSHVTVPARTYYYIKSLTFGASDLMKGLMTVRAPVADTLVITLAKCTDTTKQELLCQ
jgi:hypothetical protein